MARPSFAEARLGNAEATLVCFTAAKSRGGARAVERFGKHHIEVMAISSSWGDTMDDNEVLAALRRLNKAGSIFEYITDRAQ
jgi:hypothetical protein